MATYVGGQEKQQREKQDCHNGCILEGALLFTLTIFPIFHILYEHTVLC